MIIIGDVHGTFSVISNFITDYTITNDNLIQVGDFGIGFRYTDEEDLQLLNNLLLATENNLYVIRGNHDNPKYWIDSKKHNLSNIKFVPDYSVINVDNKNILCIGGGLSIDKSIRKPDVNYWKSENIVENCFKLNEINNIDIVLTHVPPPDIFDTLLDHKNLDYWMNRDETLKELVEQERKVLRYIHNQVLKNNKNITHWFSGHMHTSLTNNINNIKYKILTINEFFSLTSY